VARDGSEDVSEGCLQEVGAVSKRSGNRVGRISLTTILNVASAPTLLLAMLTPILLHE